ncbi:conjugal transfer protein TraN [Pseudoalteromonas luteoviolacea]|uniref:conjugal transfer protein TraN n=1 Tax=Pseudoalteromonas luteoviolacea TaxID=43657 RepID=UPI001B388394|nr:conjugal transfer protein TraN [Pseudoalteromonas luteoviolacea]MBQ4839843.1 conjugal transfer protein TraN [Pseudoalteromonas luteoviolacea]
MYIRQSKTIRQLIALLTLMMSISNVLASDIGWEPPANSHICGADLNGDGKWTSNGEAKTCIKGSTYDPDKAFKTGNGLISSPPTYICPIGQVSCAKGSKAFCPFTGEQCEQGKSTCSRNTACTTHTNTEREYHSCSTVDRNRYQRCTLRVKYRGSREILGAQCPITKRTYWANDDNPDYMGECEDNCYTSVTRYRCAQTGEEFDNNSACRRACWTWRNTTSYKCPITGNEYSSLPRCQNACKETKACKKVNDYACPLGDEYACVNTNPNSSEFTCSKNKCAAYTDNNETDPTNRDMYVDDGDYSEDGECLGQVMIFAGRAMDCRTPGISSAYQNCCSKGDGEIYNDSMGSMLDMYGYMAAISATYDAAVVAYNAYKAGATAAEAATAATDFMATSFDPATLAVSVAIITIMNYLEKACPSEDIETAILDSSGYCVALGEKCTKKWLGKCVQEVEVKCCFTSKMARIIHEQGRPQLGMTFGTADEPNCRGFDAEEFQSLDFSRIDLSEYYDELRHNKQQEMQDAIKKTLDEKLGD